MNYKCTDCEMLKFPIKQGFINGVCNNICQYVICDNCNKIINKIDDMNNRDIDNRNAETLDDGPKKSLIIYYMRAMMKEMLMILFLSIIAW